MTTLKFYKENRLDQAYTLTETELKEKFIDWLKTKEKSWLEYYAIGLVQAFITDASGLNSVAENYNNALNVLNDEVKWNYLNSIGIH